MRRLTSALIATSMLLLASTAYAQTPQQQDPSPTQAPTPAAARDAELDREHPPLGKEAVEDQARQDAARTAEEERARGEAKRAADKTRAARAAAEAKAQEKAQEKAKKAASDAPDPVVHLEGPYHGVMLDGGNPPPAQGAAHRKGRGKGATQLTWVGFRIEEGVPMVFAQLSRPAVWSVEEKPGALVYTLQSVSVPLSNNRRPLDVSAFGSPVKSVVAARRGHDVTLTVSLTGKVTHHERHQDAPGGFKFLVIELPSP